MRELGLEDQWEVIPRPAESVDLEEAIRVIEDYHPLDVECAAVALCLLRGIRERYPSLKYLLDGDGGDENLKDYPLEDSDLTLSSVLRNPLLYQEGWGVDAIKHSLTYSGGLSRSYVRTYAPGRHFGFDAFSPYTDRAAIAAALAIPFETDAGRQRRAAVHAEGRRRPRGRPGRDGDRHADPAQAPVPGRRRAATQWRGRRYLPQVARQQGVVPPGLPAPVGGPAARGLGPGRASASPATTCRARSPSPDDAMCLSRRARRAQPLDRGAARAEERA